MRVSLYQRQTSSRLSKYLKMPRYLLLQAPQPQLKQQRSLFTENISMQEEYLRLKHEKSREQFFLPP